MYQVLNQWNQEELASFLIEITRDILHFKDTDGKDLLDKIRDAAGQVHRPKWHQIPLFYQHVLLCKSCKTLQIQEWSQGGRYKRTCFCCMIVL